MTHFKVSDEALKVALSSIVMEGEDVFHSIVFGLNNDDETIRRLMAEEIVRTAIAAALPVMFEKVLYADNEVIEDAIDAVNRRHVMRYVRAWNDPIDTSTAPLFRIKEPK